MEIVGLFLHENQGQCVCQNDARSWAFKQNNQKCCSCGERAVGAGSVAKVRVGCGHHVLEPVSSLCRLQSCCPSWLVPFTLPCHADLHWFVGNEQDLYSLKDTLVALCIPTSWLSHSGLTVPFYILSCRSQFIWYAVVDLALNPPCGLTYFLVYVLADPVHLPRCYTSHTSKD